MRTQLTRVNEYFDTVISSRMNNPATDCMLIVAHRLNVRDLSGHVLEHGGWRHVCLPMIATKSTSYQTYGGSWLRQAGELLRPGAYSDNDVQRLRGTSVNPDFETLYQQNPDGEWAVHIEPGHFPSFEVGSLPRNLPVVLSIDPGHVAGWGHSYSVIQAWCQRGDVHLLIDQWREQADEDDFLRAIRRFRRKYQDSYTLIERTGFGITALAEARRRNWKKVQPIIPDGRSKRSRLLEHAQKILACHVSPAQAAWREEFIAEFVRFPHCEFDDQLDAATQYLDWASHQPSLRLAMPSLEPRCAFSKNGRVVKPPASGARVFARSTR